MNNNLLAAMAVILLILSATGQIIIYDKTARLETPSVTGKASATGSVSLVITVIPSQNFTIPLMTGKNWFSIPVVMINDNVTNALASIANGAGTDHETFIMAGCSGNASDNYDGNYSVLWTYNASDIADPWKSFTPDKPCFAIPTEDLQYMSMVLNYQIMMNQSDALRISGLMPVDYNIPLVDGKNWIGFPRVNKRLTNQSFLSISTGAGTDHDVFVMAGCSGNSSDNYVGNYTVLWLYNSSDVGDPWKSFTPDKPCFAMPTEEIQYMTPTSGYQLMTNATGTWVVNW